MGYWPGRSEGEGWAAGLKGLRGRGLWRIPLQRGEEDRVARAGCREVPTLREEEGLEKGEESLEVTIPKSPARVIASPAHTDLAAPARLGAGLVSESLDE